MSTKNVWNPSKSEIEFTFKLNLIQTWTLRELHSSENLNFKFDSKNNKVR